MDNKEIRNNILSSLESGEAKTKEVSLYDFWWGFFIRNPERIVYFKASDDLEVGEKGGNNSCALFISHMGEDCIEGYLIEKIIDGAVPQPNRVFNFSTCDHEMKNVESRMCYSESVCTKCGRKVVIDSSD